MCINFWYPITYILISDRIENSKRNFGELYFAIGIENTTIKSGDCFNFRGYECKGESNNMCENSSDDF